MESICRLCCSTTCVNNYLFDEENSLNLKMELFLPIKVMKDDKLPQKVCNRCSCRVNDIYQFCNLAIEAQDRLRSMLLQLYSTKNVHIDLKHTKRESSFTLFEDMKIDQGTQTENNVQKPANQTALTNLHSEVQIKDEPKCASPEIKEEYSVHSDYDVPPSDDSDNISLVSLKKKKNSRKPKVNGDTPSKKSKKKKSKIKDWENFMNDLSTKSGILIDEATPGKLLLEEKKVVNLKEKKRKKQSEETIKVKKEPSAEDIHQCCICFNLCYSRSEMLKHYRDHVPAEESAPPPSPPPLAGDSPCCPRCGKPVEAGGWSQHWRRHVERDRRPYRCALCEKAYRDPQQILKHGQSHKAGGAGGAGGAGECQRPPPARYVCDVCPETFVHLRYLAAHRLAAHPAAGAALQLRCPQCARGFKHLNSLRRHARAHAGTRDHLCSVCGKALSSREHLKFHLRIHSGYKPNVCKTCGKGFVKKCNLTLHERVHSGEKPHVCGTCHKAFSQRSTLVIHERYHSGARPYSCGLCGRGFVAKGLLSMHLKTTCI